MTATRSSIPLFQLCTTLIVLAHFSLGVSFADLEAIPSSRPTETYESRVPEGAYEDEVLPTSIPSQSNEKPGGPDNTALQAPNDPCLPCDHNDWREFSLAERHANPVLAQRKVILRIHRNNFILTLQAIDGEAPPIEIYQTAVGLGDLNSPTPTGSFLINHIYCYSDVVFFDSSSEKVPGLYNGCFAPLLLCDKGGERCARFNDLGIHGFRASAIPNPSATNPDTYGPVSGGCIRLPDPCSFKKELIRHVGVGPVRRNERGSYHWLNKPVDVIIEGTYPGMDDDVTIADVVQQGFTHITGAFWSILGILGR